jgi:proline iminopeptidase
MKSILYVIVIFLIASTFAGAQIKPIDSFTNGKYININGAKLWVVTVKLTQ